MGKMAFARALRLTVCRLHSHQEAGGPQGDPVTEEAFSDPEGETVETRCPVCWRLLPGSVDECPGCGADTSRAGFGLHPRREREHAIIDDCEERMIDSGVLEAGVKGVLNFAPICLKAPNGCVLSNINLETELENLIYFVNASENED